MSGRSSSEPESTGDLMILVQAPSVLCVLSSEEGGDVVSIDAGVTASVLRAGGWDAGWALEGVVEMASIPGNSPIEDRLLLRLLRWSRLLCIIPGGSLDFIFFGRGGTGGGVRARARAGVEVSIVIGAGDDIEVSSAVGDWNWNAVVWSA